MQENLIFYVNLYIFLYSNLTVFPIWNMFDIFVLVLFGFFFLYIFLREFKFIDFVVMGWRRMAPLKCERVDCSLINAIFCLGELLTLHIDVS